MLLDSRIYDHLAQRIIQNPPLYRKLTMRGNWCAIITNGTAVLGLGDIGAQAGLPVMEGKACIFKQLGCVDVVPLCIQEKDPKRLVDIICRIAPIFSAINLEDIKAPECFEVERMLQERLDIPVFHDDQHGTAIVTTAAILNALKLTDRKPDKVKIVVNGGGAAGLSISEMLVYIGVKNIVICDTKGAIYERRKENMNEHKEEIARMTNRNFEKGTLEEVLHGADVFIGVSAGGALKAEWIKNMRSRPIILAMANPEPEIYPDEALKAGAYIVCTGRSDFPNQVNNSLAFPGVFRGALDADARRITLEMKIAAAHAIADLAAQSNLSPHRIIPNSLDPHVALAVATAVAQTALRTGLSRQ